MNTLYELTDSYENILSLLYDGVTDESVIMDTLEAIDGEIEDKADNYAKLIMEMKADSAKLKKEENRLATRRSVLNNHVKSLKDRLQANLEFIGKTKFKTDLFSFNVQNNGGPQPLTITENIDEIPGKFLIPQPPKVNSEAVRELLESKEVEWASFAPRDKSLRIR